MKNLLQISGQIKKTVFHPDYFSGLIHLIGDWIGSQIDSRKISRPCLIYKRLAKINKTGERQYFNLALNVRDT